MRFIILSLFASMLVNLSMADTDQSVVVPEKSEFHLFLLAGQSNMAGRGVIRKNDSVVYSNVLALDKNGNWTHAIDPIHWDKSMAGVGLARSFALEYLKEHPKVTIGFIPAACGGSPLSKWHEGVFFDQTNSYPWDDALSRTRRALEDGELKGILWHQGESDSHPKLSGKYKRELKLLIRRFRDAFEMKTLPVVMGQLGQFGVEWGKHTKRVDKSTRRVAKMLPHVAYVSSDGLDDKGDDLHFSANALDEFGERYYEAYVSARAE